jgi:hypothetical protein
MEKFFRTYPDWRGTPPVTERFHWKWYFAMHQAGDDAVAGQVQEYRQQLLARDHWTQWSGALLASVNVQTLLHRLAGTDPQAQLAYQDRIAAFHRRYASFTTRTCSMSNRSAQPISRPCRALKRWRLPARRHWTAGWRSACLRQGQRRRPGHDEPGPDS